jgi:hypothetical protein
MNFNSCIEAHLMHARLQPASEPNTERPAALPVASALAAGDGIAPGISEAVLRMRRAAAPTLVFDPMTGLRARSQARGE